MVLTLLNQMAGGKPCTVAVVERYAAFLKPGIIRLMITMPICLSDE